jgi:hypothetical protein
MVSVMEEFLQANFVVHRATRNHILDCEFSDFDFLFAGFSNFFSIMSCRILTLLLTLCSSDDHFTRLKYQRCSSLRVLHSHDDGRKTFWIVLSIPAFQR